VRCIQAANAIIGEGPSWDASEGVLYWLDIKRPAIFRWHSEKGQTGFWPMPHPVGCAVSAGKDRLVFADAEGFGFLSLASGALERIAELEGDLQRNRFNDGKVDRAGRFWAGSMDDECKVPTGSLYRVDPDLSIHRMDTGFICSNGLGWSPDNRTMYFTDSIVRTIWAYEFDGASGALGPRRVFAQLSDQDGVPDGLTVDSEGFVWSAIWDGWRVIRYAPNGSIDREVRLPVQRPTSCMFGGPDLQTLYITSASSGLCPASLKAGPMAGAIFAVPTDVVGLPETPFAGS